MKPQDGQIIFNALMATLGEQVDAVDLQAAADRVLADLNGGAAPRPAGPPEGRDALAKIVNAKGADGVSMRLKINDAVSADDPSDLADYGLKIVLFGTVRMLAIAKTHAARDAVFGDDVRWRKAVRRLPGVVAGDGREDFGGRRSRVLLVPVGLVMEAK